MYALVTSIGRQSILLLIFVLTISACGSNNMPQPEPEPLGEQASQPSQLASPTELAAMKLPSSDVPPEWPGALDYIPGALTCLRSMGATDNGEALFLDSAEGNLAWAMYRVAIPPGSPLMELELEFDIRSETADQPAPRQGFQGVFLGLSDYSTGAWKFFGPVYTSQSIPLPAGNFATNRSGDLYISRSDLYCLVAIMGGSIGIGHVGVLPIADGTPWISEPTGWSVWLNAGHTDKELTVGVSAYSGIKGKEGNFHWKLETIQNTTATLFGHPNRIADYLWNWNLNRTNFEPAIIPPAGISYDKSGWIVTKGARLVSNAEAESWESSLCFMSLSFIDLLRTENSRTVEALPKGKYRFTVYLVNSAGLKTDEKSYEFTVPFPDPTP